MTLKLRAKPGGVPGVEEFSGRFIRDWRDDEDDLTRVDTMDGEWRRRTALTD